ncbi:MAG: DUF3833 domain-containing protein [Alphaproteobacteria bacterium]|nr:DUF3833 domain-containing protein [Alphaproteobacteria bacterium]
MKKISTILGGLALMLSGCSHMNVEDYAPNTPKLDIRQYMNGPLEAWGILYDMTGKADLRFYATMKGSWNANEGILEEDFVYSDGRKDHRVWKIQFADDHHFTATAGDVIGQATGKQFGNVANLKYVLNAKRDNGKTIHLNMDDWLYLMDDKTIINRIKMKKFGLTVGELVVTFRKP